MSDKIRIPKGARVKNKAPAPIQITAEQLILDAVEQAAATPKLPKQKITDADELAEFQVRLLKRMENGPSFS